MNISNNLQKIKADITNKIKLVAVSKTKPNNYILEAYNAGHRIFGENKVQELVKKYEELPKDIEWHFIGHLQTNKVKFIAPFVRLIHAVDSLKLLVEINKEAEKNNRIISCLLQLRIAKEETKFGLTESDLLLLLESNKIKSLKNISFAGLMGMATFTEDETLIAMEFQKLNNTFKHVKKTYFAENEDFKELSMGMSDDYKIAIEKGSTIIRVGSSIFGHR